MTIDYAIARTGPAHLQLFDVRGRLVRTLADGTCVAGAHRAIWDGRDSAGRLVAGGIYFCRLRANGKAAVRKIVMVE